MVRRIKWLIAVITCVPITIIVLLLDCVRWIVERIFDAITWIMKILMALGLVIAKWGTQRSAISILLANAPKERRHNEPDTNDSFRKEH